jgi:hypothetical protein
MTKFTAYIFGILVAALVTLAFANPGHAFGMDEDRWACEQDAFKFCSNEIPNVSRITECMFRNRKKLSPPCRAKFK